MAASELESWFRKLPYKLKREFAGQLNEIAERLAEDIRDAAPEKSGRLKESIRVRRGRNTLELYVEAGGSTTTRAIERAEGYEREVAIGQGDTQGISRGGESVTYDYALAQEFGTQKMPANPFFYTTFRAQADDIREEIDEAVSDILAKA